MLRRYAAACLPRFAIFHAIAVSLRCHYAYYAIHAAADYCWRAAAAASAHIVALILLRLWLFAAMLYYFTPLRADAAIRYYMLLTLPYYIFTSPLLLPHDIRCCLYY